MRKLFSVENIVKTYIKVERALMKALGEAGLAPPYCHHEIEKCAESIDPMEVYRREAITGHDIASLAFILGEKCGKCGDYVHLGATSYDIVDTTWTIILRDALLILRGRLREVIRKLMDLSMEHIDTYVIGRTHGQHALPITFGFKFANHAYELARSYERLIELEKRLVRLKMSGSVGTMASWREKGFLIEEIVARELCLEPHAITTQISPRDGFAELVSVLAILASQLDRLALEIRELSRTEIGEVYEKADRIGSSAMPHKRNPVVAERISGLAKIARGLVITALENIVLMHERDLTNSSSERLMIPHVVLTLDQMLNDTVKMLSTIKIDKERARLNIDLTRGAIYSELLVTKLVEKGFPRHEAYLKIKKIIESIKNEDHLVSAILSDPEISKHFNEVELTEILDPRYACVNIRRLVERSLEYIRRTVFYESRVECLNK